MCRIERRFSPAVNIVALQDEIVAQDVALTLTDLYPGTETVTVADRGLLSKIIESRDLVQIAVLEMTPSEFRAWPEAARLSARGARVLLIAPPEPPGAGAPFSYRTLEKPFTTEALVAVLTTTA